jgi:CBS domain-containing protein
MIDRNKIVDGVSEVCRHRSVTHVIMSKGAYKAYASKLDPDFRKRGVKNSTCHDVALFPVGWIPEETDHVVLGFNPKRSKRLVELLALIVVEEDEIAEDIATSMLESDYRYLHVFHLPVVEEEDDEDEGDE